MNSMIPPFREETLTERIRRYLEEKAARERADPYYIAQKALMADWLDRWMEHQIRAKAKTRKSRK